MRLRIPPGRAGRLWLRVRLDAARKAADLLSHKRRELEVELQRVGQIAGQREKAWLHAARDASRWMDRVDATGAEHSLRLAISLEGGPATVELQWQQIMGVRYPADFTVRFPPEPCIRSLDGGAALTFALEAHRHAVEAALEHAVAKAAVGRIRMELDRTVRRVRALELRAIPAHEAALAALELALDEKDREEAVAARWAAGETPTRPGGGRAE